MSAIKTGDTVRIGAYGTTDNFLSMGPLRVGADVGSAIQAADIAVATGQSLLLNPFGGNVGIGTTSPRSILDVSGAITGKASTLNGTATVDFSVGNIQHTTSSCGAFNFWNLKDGGTYMFVVKGTTSATCSFTAYSDGGTTGLTVHLPPGHGATTTGGHTLYNIAVSGGDVYIAWTPGY